MQRVGRCSVVAVMVFLAVGGARAQTNTGEIAGVVRDSSGGVLPGATVTARHRATGFVVDGVTERDGRFFFPGLRVGTWEVTANLRGFAGRTQTIVLEIGATPTLEFTLGLAGLTENVNVAASAPLLQTTAEISDVIENRQVVELPLNGRNFLALAQVSDAVVIPPGGTRGDALQQAGPLPNIGGQRSGHNIYLLDGVKVTDELFNNLVVNPSVDSIEEFKIQKSMYAPEFGGKASALINVATKSGTNLFHGSLFEFGRHDRFDALNYFHPPNQPKPRLRQNQFGGSLGGPIARDRTFFFVSYEGQRARRSVTRTFSVPSDAVRRGDFSGLAPICDPLTIDDATGVCTPFPDSRIPEERIDSLSAAFLQHVARPTSDAPFQNLTSVSPQPRDVSQYSLRLDDRRADRDQFMARFSTFDADERQPFGTSALQEALIPGFGRSVATHTRNLAVSHTRVFGRARMNEIRAGYMNVTGGQLSVNRGADFAGQTGLLGVTRDPRDVGFPQISTGGLYSTMGDPTSFTYRRNRHVEVYENFLVDHGAHRFKVGAYWFNLILRPEQADNARGAFTYTGQFTGNAFADFLLDYPTSATSGIGRGSEDGRTDWLHVYAQDDWRLRDSLTINAGVRYEYNQHLYDTANRLSSIDLSVPGGRYVIASDSEGRLHPDAFALLPQIPIPWVSSKDAGWTNGLLRPNAVRLAPRTGFAWTVHDSRAVVRGGYGVFLNQWAYSVQTALARNLPFFFTKQVDVPADTRIPVARTRDVLAGDSTGIVGGSTMDHDYAVEYTQTWSGGVQYELNTSTMVEVAYMGSWTRGADNATVHNVPTPGPGAIQARRPIPQLSAIRSIRFDGRALYHALIVKSERRLRDSVGFTVSYTLSRSVDDASSPGPTEAETNVPQNVRDIFKGEWAPSSFDHRHLFAATGTWQAPSAAGANGIRAAVLQGWRVNGILSLQSGSPFTVNIAADRANIGAGPAQRPNQFRDPNLPGGSRTPDRWFDTNAFVLQPPFVFGNAPRNGVIGPGLATVDAAIARTWAVRASSLEFRWEIFNLFNRANFDLPNHTFGTPNFGRIFSARSPREMQFGIRLAF